MERLPRLNLPDCNLDLRREKDVVKVKDNIRGCWLVLTPEEWVRRHIIGYLTQHHGIVPQMIAQEYPVDIQGMCQRADIVVFGKNALPLLLVECKAPSVAIDAKVYAQSVRYNTVVGARYIMLSNGIRHFIYQKGADGGYDALAAFPDLV